MGQSVGIKHINISKKIHKCCWCGEYIEIGQSYFRWRWYADGEAGTVKMHPECESARVQLMKDSLWDGEWCTGEFERGGIGEANHGKTT